MPSKKESFLYEVPRGWEAKIELNSLKKNGKPCVVGTDIAVYEVIDKLACLKTFSKVREFWPILKDGDIEACLALAARSFNWDDSLEMGEEEEPEKTEK